MDRNNLYPRVLVNAGTGVGKSRIMKCIPPMHFEDLEKDGKLDDSFTRVYVLFINDMMKDRDIDDFEAWAIAESLKMKHGLVHAYTSLSDCAKAVK